ncbi:MAG: Zn-ribbon domain-containing OB-fold protein [Thermomicrobiales bacterium]
MTETVRIPGEWHIRYQYTIGTFASAFFEGLRRGEILGSLCEQNNEVSVPPKSFNERAFVPTDKLVKVGLSGTIQAVTIVTAPFAGSPEVPYAVAYVQLDGATSSIANYVRGVDLGDGTSLPRELQIEASVHVVFSASPQGRVTDFWFEPGRA